MSLRNIGSPNRSKSRDVRVKGIVLIRGKTSDRKEFCKEFNKEIEKITGDVDADVIRQRDYGDSKSASSTARNAFKRTYQNHRNFIIIDHDHEIRREWKRYLEIAETFKDLAYTIIGIDLDEPINNDLKKDADWYTIKPENINSVAKSCIELLSFTRQSLRDTIDE